jgi:hypothetical protein
VVLVAVTVAPLACGGGGGSAGGTFCQDWAKATCHKVYQCPTADSNPLAGTSEANCAAGFTQLCANKPPADETFDVNCSAGQAINKAAKTSCLNSLATVTCDAFNSPTYTDTCAQVCPQGTDNGSAGASGGTAGASGGSAGASGGSAGASGGTAGGTVTASADVTMSCHQYDSVLCDQAFTCIPVAERDDSFTAAFGATITDCKTTIVTNDCATETTDCTSYSQTFATACLQKTIAQTCDDVLAGNTPSECDFVCQ